MDYEFLAPNPRDHYMQIQAIAGMQLPFLTSTPVKTMDGVSVLVTSGVSVLAYTRATPQALAPYLRGFEQFSSLEYERDFSHHNGSGGVLAKMAGQLCYQSFGPKRSRELLPYLDHIKDSGHGSVLEHGSCTVLLYGVDRAFTHQLVRHRAGASYSQVSQRYTSAETLRFCLRAEFRGDQTLQDMFQRDVAHCAKLYAERIEVLKEAQNDSKVLSGESATEKRKKVQQAARDILPNCTEAPIVVTYNYRAWRHFLEQRAHAAADVNTREVAMRVYECLKRIEPEIFSDYEVMTLPDGTNCLQTKWRKVLCQALKTYHVTSKRETH